MHYFCIRFTAEGRDSHVTSIDIHHLMKERSLYFIKTYLTILAVFVIQKPLFMAIDAPSGSNYGLGDYLAVMGNGLLLDIPMTGYLTALPLLLTLVSLWIPRRLAVRKWTAAYLGIVALLVSSIFVADIALYPFWQFKLDATIFMYLDSPKGAFASVSPGFIVIHTLAALLLSVLTFGCLWAVTPRYLQSVSSWRRKVAGTLAGLVAIVPFAISIRGGTGESTANVGKVYFSEDTYLNHAAINPTFSMVYSLDKTSDYADEFNYYPEHQRATLFKGLYRPTSSDCDSLLTTDRPNVLIILMEGFGGQFIEAVSGRKDIAPNYNRLAREGILFTRCYSNSFRTDRGTVSTLSGYPSFPTLSVMKIPVKSRTLPCIANSLNAAGYESSFLYGGDINFTNMQSYLRTGGYKTIISDVDFPASQRKDNQWGVNDDITFDRLYDMVSGQRHQPWHLCFLTLSSHEPFVVPYHRLKDPIPNAFAYTDECLGRFVERIRNTPLWKNLLIVCIPDHGFPYPEGISHECHHHNAMLWLGGAVRKPLVVSTVMNQSDMAATLLGQLRLPHGQYTFSRDVLSRQYRQYPFAFFTFKEGIGFKDSTGYSVYDIVSDKVSESRGNPSLNPDRQKDAARLRVMRAKAILQSFYDDFGNR